RHTRWPRDWSSDVCSSDLSAGKPAAEDLLLSQQSDTEAYYGRLTKARDFSRRAADSAIRADSKETAALWRASAALREAEFGNPEIGRASCRERAESSVVGV